VFDVKMDLTRKARFVAGGHWLEPDETWSFSTSVMHVYELCLQLQLWMICLWSPLILVMHTWVLKCGKNAIPMLGKNLETNPVSLC
jgi:hypothetical protein